MEKAHAIGEDSPAESAAVPAHAEMMALTPISEVF